MASVLALGGLGVAIYLSVTHATGQPVACTGIGDCNYVNGSEYSKVSGVPVATLGAGAYVTIFTFATGALLMRWRSWLLAAWSIAFASFAFSLYLTYIELFVLEAICVWCVASASIATALFLALTGVLCAEPPHDN
jgi:uncharacterized membrane protein